MGNKIKITTPRGQIFTITTSSGKAEAVLKWNPNFASSKTRSFNSAQGFVDSEVVRCCSALVPFRTGMLMKSGELGTVVGSGVVQYIAPYSRVQYKTAPTRNYNKRRGGMWFERMKSSEGKRILSGARRIAMGR